MRHYIIPICLSWVVMTSFYCWWYDLLLDHLWEQNIINGKEVKCSYSILQSEEICRPSCENGSFILHGMNKCQPWLQCDDIHKDVQIGEEIGRGAVKIVYLARWKKFHVAWNQPITNEYLEDYQHGVEIFKTLNDVNRIVQVIGICGDIIITEFQQFRSALKINNILSTEELTQYNTLVNRFNLCIDYVDILSYLHDRTRKYIYVMCDSSNLEKTLQQYLVTEDLHLVLNDVDSLAQLDHANNELIRCGHRELSGDFVAPEQLWPFDDDFVDERMPGYDEKSDIWKVPDVCNHFLQFGSAATRLKFKLFDIHSRCKHNNPKLRPSASEILLTYHQILQEI